jgi:hypothetical protein
MQRDIPKAAFKGLAADIGTVTDKIESHVQQVLIPEMRGHYETFISHMDALVWFKVSLWVGTGNAVSKEGELEYGMIKHTPAFRISAQHLGDLYGAAMNAKVRGAQKPVMTDVQHK